MKILALVMIMVSSLQLHAQARQITLEGKDAEKLMEIFKGVSQNSSVGNPVTGSISHMFMHFRPGIGAFTLDCVEKGLGISSETRCQLSFDPIRANAAVIIRNPSSTTMEAIFSDPEINRKIQNDLIGGEFVSETKAADGMSPLVTLSCLAPSVCRLTVNLN